MATDYTGLINQTYQDVLGRSAAGDTGGFDFWKNQLTSGAVTPDTFKSAFTAAAKPELDVQGLYKTGLNRQADMPGLSYWTQKIGSDGITDEERQQFMASAQPELDVQKLYSDILKRQADMSGLEYWTKEIGSGGITEEERQRFINEAIKAGELKNTNLTGTGTGAGTGSTAIQDVLGGILGQAVGLGPAVYDAQGNLISGTPFKAYDASTAAGYADIAKNLVAGPTQTQTDIFKGIGSLTTPAAITDAAARLKELGQTSMPFTPTTFTNQYQAPGTYTGATITPEQFNLQNLQPYMNPYLEAVLEPQRREAQRQADIARTAIQTKLSQAGAYGGSRQAIMEAEGQRNLQTLLDEITGKGYAGAYESAAKQFEDAFNRQLAAAKFGEESRQFGYGKQMDAASEAAKYGLEALKGTEASKKLAADVGLELLGRQTTAAEAAARAGALEGQYGLDALKMKTDIAEQERALQQKAKDIAYQQFLREQGYPYEQLKFVSDIASKIPGLGATTTTPGQTDYEAFIKGMQDALALVKTAGGTKP
jgi:hypothetical protein